MKSVFAGAVLGILLSGTAFTQSPATLPEFEVADVQPSKPGTEPDFNFQPGGRLELRGLSMKELIAGSWDLEDDMVVGGPAWLDSERFDIVAKAPNSAPEATLRLMLRALLIERFKLATHSGEKVVPVYALSVGKHTPKLKGAAAGSAEGDCKMQVIDGIRTFVCHNMTMEGLAQRLRPVAAAYLDHPVVDLTGLKGAYDFTVAWTGRGKLFGRGGAGDGSAIAGAAEPISGLTVFDAVNKQLGLDLAARKHPMPTVVVDHVDRTPTAN